MLAVLLCAALTLFSSPTPATAQESPIPVSITAGDGIVVVNGENRVEGGSFKVTITFSEDIGTTFTHSDITASNADTITAADLTTDTAGLVFTLTVRPTAGFSGDLTLQVGAGVATDASSKANAQSNLFTAAVTVKSACITGGAVQADAPDLAGDCAVLLDLHNQLTGSAILSPAWSVTTAIGSWQGITVRNSRVGTLQLIRLSLDGTLPAELGQLSGLTELYLNGNQITGTIPAELGSLSKLRELTLHENMLTGAIPAELGRLPLLERMTLSTNRLTGTIPGELGSLSSLWGLILTDNQLTGAIPGELGSLPALRDLKLSNNQLSGSIPPKLGSLPALEELILYSNQLTGSIPPELGSLSTLEVLELSRNRLTGAIPAEIGSLSNVTQLYLYTNQLTGPLPAALGNMTALQYFQAYYNEITGPIPSELGDLANLKDLELFGNNLSGNIPTALGDLSNLQLLYLQDNQLEGAVPASLSMLQTLRHLRLDENRLTGSIPDLSNMAELTFLSLGKNQLTGSIPALSNMPKLNTLHLHCNQLSGNIPAALGALTALKNISLRDNDLTGEIPDLTALTNLNSLSVHYNYLEGDFTDVASLLAKLPTVSYLRIRLNANRFDGVDPITGVLSEPPSWLDPQSRSSCAPRVSFIVDEQSVAEGDTVGVTVVLSADPGQSVVIPLATDKLGTAEDADFNLPPSITFEQFETGESMKTEIITFTAVQDMTDDDDEGVSVRFGTLPEGIRPVARVKTTVSIIDDDDPQVNVSYGLAEYTAAEGGSVTVTVKLDADPERTVVIPITDTPQAGASSADYSGVPLNVTFDAGDTAKTFTFSATDDAIDDDGERVLLAFGTLPAGVSAGNVKEALVGITDDDLPATQHRVCTNGEITVRGQNHRWDWRITDSSYRDEYTIDLMGLHSNKGTLRDPHIVYKANRYTHDEFYPPGPSYGTFPAYWTNDRGVGWDSSTRLRFRTRTGSHSYFPGKEPELDTGYYTVLVGANPFGDGANGLGSYTLCIEGPGSITEVDQPERRIVVSAAHVDVSDGEPAQFSIKLGVRPTGPVEVFMMKLEPASDSQYVVEPLMHSFTVDNWDIPQVATVRRKADYALPMDDGFAIHYWGKGGGYHTEFEFLEVYDRVPGWMVRRLTYDPEPALTHQVSEAQQQNSRATGGPSIQGAPRTGETLTATTSGIRDDDGLDNAVFAYQWVRSELGADSGTDIAGATGSRYVVTAEDEGKAITVEVSFTDDAGNDESVISYAVVVALSPPQTRAPDAPGAPDVSAHDSTSLAVSWTAPASDGGSAVTGYKVQWKEAADSWDTTEDVSEAAVTGTSHTIAGLTDGTAYSVRVLAINDVGESLPSDNGDGTPRETVPPELSGASVDGAALTLAFNEALDENSEPASAAFMVKVSGNAGAVDAVDVSGSSVTLTLASAVTSQDQVTVSYTVPTETATARLKDLQGNPAESFADQSVTNNTAAAEPPPSEQQRQNSPATGSPTITGTAEVGEPLTASTTGIADTDGLDNVSYSYQWIRNDGSSDTDISGATSSTYTLVDSDEGNTIKVRVSFTDDAGNEETLTSAATGEVVAAPSLLTVSLENSPASHNGTDVFTFQIRFSEELKLSFKTLRDHAFTVDGGTVKKAKRQVKGSNIGWTITVEPDSDAAVRIVLPATTDCDATGAICTEDGRQLSDSLDFTVSGPS